MQWDPYRYEQQPQDGDNSKVLGKILRIFCGFIALVLLTALCLVIYHAFDSVKSPDYFVLALSVFVLVPWIVLFGLVTFKKYRGNPVAFVSWLILFPLLADLADRFQRYGAGYFKLDITLAYLLVFCILFLIAVHRNVSWLQQAVSFVAGAAIVIGGLQWIAMSRALEHELNDLDLKMSFIHKRLDGSDCYIPLKDMTPGMVQIKIDSIDKVLEFSKTYLPDRPPVDSFSQAAYAEAKLAGMQLADFDYVGTRDEDFYSETFFRGRVTATNRKQYEQFKHRLENMQWLLTWEKESNTATGYAFSGRLYAYLSEDEVAAKHRKKAVRDITLPNKKTGKGFCELEATHTIWWPPYARRLQQKRDAYTSLCRQQLPYQHILDLERILNKKTNAALARFDVVHELSKTTNNQVVKRYKADIPIPCYKDNR